MMQFSRILKVKKHLGLFDNRVPHAYKENYIGNSDHRNLARQAVRESIVLLKNNDVLPYEPKEEFFNNWRSIQTNRESNGWLDHNVARKKLGGSFTI